MFRTFVASVFVFLIAVPSAHAQQRPAQLLIGATFAHMTFDSTPELATSWRGNLTFGIDFGVPLFPQDSPVQLRAEAMLVARGGHVDNGQFVEKIKLLYVDVAGLIDWNVVSTAGDNGFHVLVGPSLGIRTSAAASINGIAVDPGGVFRRFDVGLAVGTNFTLIKKKLDLQALYIAGLMNILTDDPYTSVFFPPGSTARNQTLLIMVLPTIWR